MDNMKPDTAPIYNTIDKDSLYLLDLDSEWTTGSFKRYDQYLIDRYGIEVINAFESNT